MSVIALVPARSGSKGVPGKNFRKLGDRSLLGHAAAVGRAVSECVIVSSDISVTLQQDEVRAACRMHFLQRPPELAQDDTPMLAVVQHAISLTPGAPDDIWVILQPTQPFRKACHIQAAIALLRESGADSVVSVVELPRTHHPNMQLWISRGLLCAWSQHQLGNMPACRQEMDARPTFIKDGTVYAFRRATVERYGNIYGNNVRPLLMAPEDTCELDTEEQWAEVERRWKERHG